MKYQHKESGTTIEGIEWTGNNFEDVIAYFDVELESYYPRRSIRYLDNHYEILDNYCAFPKIRVKSLVMQPYINPENPNVLDLLCSSTSRNKRFVQHVAAGWVITITPVASHVGKLINRIDVVPCTEYVLFTDSSERDGSLQENVREMYQNILTLKSQAGDAMLESHLQILDQIEHRLRRVGGLLLPTEPTRLFA
jgi:hypothetical protein